MVVFVLSDIDLVHVASVSLQWMKMLLLGIVTCLECRQSKFTALTVCLLSAGRNSYIHVHNN